MTVKLVYAKETITTFLQVQASEPVIYVEQILVNARREGLARCKFYLLTDKYKISRNF